jgi:hypothetical protein
MAREAQRPSPEMVFSSLPPRRVRRTSSRSGGRDSRPRGRGLKGDRPRPLDLREEGRGITKRGEASPPVARRIRSARGRGHRAPLGASEEGAEHLARQDLQHDCATFAATLALVLTPKCNGWSPMRRCAQSAAPRRCCTPPRMTRYLRFFSRSPSLGPARRTSLIGEPRLPIGRPPGRITSNRHADR